MKLWLDDIRPAPEGWVWVKTAYAAKAHLARFTVEVASLDHDLGICQECESALLQPDSEICMATMLYCEHNGSGADVAKWLAENPDRCPTSYIIIHSFNIVGAVTMQKILVDKVATPCFISPYKKSNYVTV